MELSNSTHLTLQRELHFVAAYKLIVFHPLHPKLKNGTCRICGINMAGSSLSCIINLLTLILQLQGSSNGFFESKPTALGYTRPWDVSEVLCYLGTIYNSEDLSLWNVTFKTVMVVSVQRGLTIYFCIVTLMIR